MRLNCPLMIFRLCYNLIKDSLSGLSKRKVRFILHVTIRRRFFFSLLQTIGCINVGLVRMYVTPYNNYIRFGNKLYKQIVGKQN